MSDPISKAQQTPHQSNKSIAVEFRARHRDGSWRWVEASCVNRDITSHEIITRHGGKMWVESVE